MITGLGNPGKSYSLTRHNVGFRCVNLLARRHDIAINKRQSRAHVGLGHICDHDVVLAKPKTFMNLSGGAVSLLARRYKVGPAGILIIHDDLDLSLARIRVYHDGGSGGHRGVESVVRELGTSDFMRVRIGVGRPPDGYDPVEYVLSDFNSQEQPLIDETIARAADAVECLLREGASVAMNRFN